MATQVNIGVTIKSKQGNIKVSPVSSLSIKQSINAHHSFSLRCSFDAIMFNEKSIEKVSEAIIGKSLLITMNTVGENSDGSHSTFKGIITNIQYNNQDGHGRFLTITGYSPSILLDSARNTISFSEKNSKQLMDVVIGSDYDADILKKNFNGSPGATIPYIVQYRETAYNFLKRLAASDGSWFYYDGNILQFGKPSTVPELSLNFKNDIQQLSYSMNLNHIGFENASFDYLQNETYTSPATKFEVSGVENLTKVAYTESKNVFTAKSKNIQSGDFISQSELDNSTKVKRAQIASSLFYLNASSDRPDIVPGCKVKIEAPQNAKSETKDEFGKTYLVTSVEHSSNGAGNYQNSFTAIPATFEILPRGNFEIPFAEVHTAVVLDNDDPKKLGRIKVKFHWQEDGDSSNWVLIAMPYAGKERGTFFIPEIDDEVLVAFENGNPDLPYVIGSLYKKGAEPPAQMTDNINQYKVIVTKTGQSVGFRDTDDDTQATALVNDLENYMIIGKKDGGKASLKTKKKIRFNSEEITIDAKTLNINVENINFKISQNWKEKVDGKKEIKVTQDFKTEVTQNIEVKATMDLKQSAMNIKNKADMNIENKAGMQNTTEGAMTEVKGSGMTTIKGGIVMIN